MRAAASTGRERQLDTSLGRTSECYTDAIMALTADLFLGTQVFVANNFDVRGKRFASLVQLVKESRVRIFMTTVTTGEVKRQLTQQVKLAVDVFHQYELYLNSRAQNVGHDLRAGRVPGTPPRVLLAPWLAYLWLAS